MSGPITRPVTSSATRDLWKVAETGEIGELIELLARGADVNDCNQAGVTALMVAAHNGRLEMVRALTDHGADVDAVDRDGFTAAMLAHHSHRQDIVRLLVARGARIIPRLDSADTSPPALGPPPEPVESRPVWDDTETRKLDDPPNIWDVVHETHIAFDPRSAFFNHLRSINPYTYALIAVIVGGVGLLGFIWLRGGTGTTPAPDVNIENHKQIVTASPAVSPETAASSDQQAIVPDATESPSAQKPESKPVAPRLATTAITLKPVPASGAERPRRVAPTPDQTNKESSTGATLNSPGNPENPDKAPTPTTPATKSDVKKSAEPQFGNRNGEKLPTPAPVLSPRMRPTPNN